MRFLLKFLLITLICCKDDTVTPVIFSSNGEANCTVKTFTPVSGKYAACLPALDNTTFDIMTWNIENFPKKSSETIAMLTEIIQTLSPDVIAFQEISSATSFNQFVSGLSGYKGYVSGGSLKVGYLYKESEVTLTKPIELTAQYEIFQGDSYAFPRTPYVTTATHVSGKEITLINLHLKCCDDGTSIPQRKDASVKMKKYIDENLNNKSVIMLGDFNEDITQPEGNDVFTNFVNDSDNYKFADMDIAKCSEANWSYPSWPSHLDHMLITNELFNAVKDVRTIKLKDCESKYFTTVSDHYPVMINLQ